MVSEGLFKHNQYVLQLLCPKSSLLYFLAAVFGKYEVELVSAKWARFCKCSHYSKSIKEVFYLSLSVCYDSMKPGVDKIRFVVHEIIMFISASYQKADHFGPDRTDFILLEVLQTQA